MAHEKPFRINLTPEEALRRAMQAKPSADEPKRTTPKKRVSKRKK